MKRYSLFIFIVIISLFSCEKKDKTSLLEIHWDRDVCERCAMLISDKKYVTQIRNIKTSKKKKFDDIGCAISWLIENEKNWQNNTNIWVKDTKSMRWINAKIALWTIKNISPMGYGLLAHTKKMLIKDRDYINFKQVIEEIKQKNMDNKNAKHKH